MGVSEFFQVFVTVS